jgi:YtkA-like
MRSLVALLLATVLHAGCSSAAVEPSVTLPPSPPLTASPTASASPSGPIASPTPIPNLQAGVVSEDGLFRASWESRPADPPINAVHEWVLHIETADGEPAAGAIVTVDGDMPAHGHGMPTEPQVTADLGNGDYLVEGMAFQMGGYWVVDVAVTYEGVFDLVRFGLDL